MECYSCHGTMTKGTTTYTVNRKGYHFIIHDVPAWVCQQCGEALFEEETVDAVQQLIRTMDVGVTRLVTQPA